MLLKKQDLDLKLQKLQDFKTIFEAIHLPFKIVVNLTILENSQEYVYSEVYIYKTVKCEVINVEFLSEDYTFIPFSKDNTLYLFLYIQLEF